MKDKGPLEGLTVLDLTTNISGPVATHVLANLGATVWKVERPDGGDDARQMAPVVGGESAYFIVINSSKKSIALDLPNRRAKEIVKKLVKRSDILVENYRPGVAERLGVGWEAVHKINPKLVYASISGYGGKGPDGLRAGYDALLQARTGLFSVTGHPGQPPVRIGVSILDVSSGMWSALGILAALLQRGGSGCGRRISTSLFETGVFLFAYHLMSYQLTGRVPGPHGTEHPAFSPYGSFAVAGGERIMIGVSNDRQFQRLCKCLGHSEWAQDPRYRANVDRVKNKDDLRRQMESLLRKTNSDDWEKVLTEADVPISRLQDARDVLNDPQAGPLSLFQLVTGSGKGSLNAPRIPLRISDFELKSKGLRAPHLGEHTRQILRSVGFEDKRISELEAEGVVKEYSKDGSHAA